MMSSEQLIIDFESILTHTLYTEVVGIEIVSYLGVLSERVSEIETTEWKPFERLRKDECRKRVVE